MTDLTAPSHALEIPSRAIFGFLGLTFAITWGLVGCYIVAPNWATASFGTISGSHPFFFLATWAPAMSAFAVVVFFGGVQGLKTFLSRLFLWRGSLPWALFILLVIPAVFTIGSLIKGGGAICSVAARGRHSDGRRFPDDALPRTYRGIRLARGGATHPATAYGTALGWDGDRHDLGNMASSGDFLGWDGFRRMELLSVSRWQHHLGRSCDASVQCLSW